MKKIVCLLMIIIMFNIPTIVSAQDGSFTIVETSNKSYAFTNSVNNIVTNETEGIAYVGFTLDNYIFNTLPKRENAYALGKFTWENPKYKIIAGEQFVTLFFDDSFTSEKITVKVKIDGVSSGWKKYKYESHKNYTFERYEGSAIEKVIPNMFFYDSVTNEMVNGSMTYTNTDDLSIGNHDIGWTFTPNDSSYVISSGVFKVKIIVNPNQEESIATTLTSNTIILNKEASYDINLNEKVEGSTYAWSTSNPKVASVNAKSGIVTGLKNGGATITCKVTAPDNKTYNLTSDVIVGEDDNFPTLTDTELDLGIGDKYTIYAENLVSKSKIKWTTSDKTIVKVNTSTGVISCVNEGVANVYCTITAKDKTIIVLKCEVTINK